MTETIVSIVFWIAFLGLVYSYGMYPLILRGWRALRRRPGRKNPPNIIPAEDTPPTVSVVISAYNEEAIIGKKIENIRRTDYPGDRIEFLVGSDGSTDATEERLASSGIASLKVLRFPQRRGKAAVLNDLVTRAKGEIIVFSDANTMYEPTTIRRLVSPFADPAIGGVLGELSLVSNGDTLAEHAESFYWRYENAMKMCESEIFSTLGGIGPLYAIRKSLFTPLPQSKIVMDDFLVGLAVLARGFRVVFDPHARGYEDTSGSVAQEFRRKTRIALGNYSGISEFYGLLSPKYGFIAFALWSHKILRWMGWAFLVAIVCASVYLSGNSSFFRIVCILEIVAAALVAVGVAAERLRWRIGILGVPYHFMAMNAALALGFVKFLFGRRQPSWEVIRHKGSLQE